MVLFEKGRESCCGLIVVSFLNEMRKEGDKIGFVFLKVCKDPNHVLKQQFGQFSLLLLILRGIAPPSIDVVDAIMCK